VILNNEADHLAGAHLLTIHNVHYQLSLMGQAREAIKQDQYPQFVRKFFGTLYHGDNLQYPKWAIDALKTVGIDLLEGEESLEQHNALA
jgi:queuine tRNA-ribosyltransferase catalytic subunit